MPIRPRPVTGLRVLTAVSMLAASVSGASAHPSLYAQMGGTKVVAAFVSVTIDQVAADPKLNQSFRDVNLGRVKRELTS